MTKISLRQLRQLIREAVEEQMGEISGGIGGIGGRGRSYMAGSAQKLSSEVPKFDLRTADQQKMDALMLAFQAVVAGKATPEQEEMVQAATEQAAAKLHESRKPRISRKSR